MEAKTRNQVSCISRGDFFLKSGAVSAAVLLTTIPGFNACITGPALVTNYARKRIASLSDAKLNQPIHFKYPDEDPVSAASFLVKLGTPAGGAIGPENDIVAFNSLCTHMGGPLMGTYKKDYKAVGPCPFHLSTFDLTKHGMIIAGHGTESLPQIILEVENNDVYAVGMIGLIYGRASNLTA